MNLQNFLSDLRITVATSSFIHILVERANEVLGSQTWVNVVFILRAAGLLVTLIMIYLVIFVVIKTNLIPQKLLPLKIVLNRPNKTKDSGFVSRMNEIKKRIERKNPDEDRLAVLAASQLLESGLAKLGQKKPLFRENIESIPYWSSVTPDKIFSAYNTRTKLVHNPNERVSHEEAEEAVETFEKAIRDLGVI